MKNTLKALSLVTAMALPLAAHAADKTTDTPPQNTAVYPCWDMMKDGKMMQMRGMWDGGDRQGHMMMMQQQDVQGMQKEIDDLRKQVEELKKK
jgi:peptidoglycan hydrolase CwlO-like protein